MNSVNTVNSTHIRSILNHEKNQGQFGDQNYGNSEPRIPTRIYGETRKKIVNGFAQEYMESFTKARRSGQNRNDSLSTPRSMVPATVVPGLPAPLPQLQVPVAHGKLNNPKSSSTLIQEPQSIFKAALGYARTLNHSSSTVFNEMKLPKWLKKGGSVKESLSRDSTVSKQDAPELDINSQETHLENQNRKVDESIVNGQKQSKPHDYIHSKIFSCGQGNSLSNSQISKNQEMKAYPIGKSFLPPSETSQFKEIVDMKTLGDKRTSLEIVGGSKNKRRGQKMLFKKPQPEDRQLKGSVGIEDSQENDSEDNIALGGIQSRIKLAIGSSADSDNVPLAEADFRRNASIYMIALNDSLIFFDGEEANLNRSAILNSSMDIFAHNKSNMLYNYSDVLFNKSYLDVKDGTNQNQMVMTKYSISNLAKHIEMDSEVSKIKSKSRRLGEYAYSDEEGDENINRDLFVSQPSLIVYNEFKSEINPTVKKFTSILADTEIIKQSIIMDFDVPDSKLSSMGIEPSVLQIILSNLNSDSGSNHGTISGSPNMNFNLNVNMSKLAMLSNKESSVDLQNKWENGGNWEDAGANRNKSESKCRRGSFFGQKLKSWMSGGTTESMPFNHPISKLDSFIIKNITESDIGTRAERKDVPSSTAVMNNNGGSGNAGKDEGEGGTLGTKAKDGKRISVEKDEDSTGFKIRRKDRATVCQPKQGYFVKKPDLTYNRNSKTKLKIDGADRTNGAKEGNATVFDKALYQNQEQNLTHGTLQNRSTQSRSIFAFLFPCFQ